MGRDAGDALSCHRWFHYQRGGGAVMGSWAAAIRRRRSDPADGHCWSHNGSTGST